MTQSFTIGLTGGIASGKSAVSDKFKEIGCTIIDADIVARDVVRPDSYGLSQLVNIFGNKILDNNNNLDRLGLRRIVFNDEDKLAELNAITHPLIKKQILEEIKQVKKTFCIVVIPLLCESSRYDWLDRVLVVDVKPKTQMQRLLKRDNITPELAKNMIKSQCSRDKRLALADDVINNELSLKQLDENVKILYKLYNSLEA